MSNRPRNPSSIRHRRRPGSTPARVNVPGYLDRRPLTLREVPPRGPVAEMMINPANSYLRCYELGECTIMVTREYGEWHLSIAHRARDPEWDEIAEARYRLIPDDVTMAMILPPKAQYVNVHKFCFQLVQVPDRHEGSHVPRDS